MNFVTRDHTILVPAGEARGALLRAGQHLTVIDPEGEQVGDLFAYPDDPSHGRHLSAAHTRAHVNRLFPQPGEAFVTDLRTPVLTLVEDNSPGRHDMLIPACDAVRYAALGAPPGHPSCAANLNTVLTQAGRDTHTTVPQPVNVFMDIRVGTDSLAWFPASTKPGDSITLQAATDCLVVVSACPQDLSVINNGSPTPLELHLH
ncbi:DUF1989 domain-containing protein [Streptomyces lushanensis]|uniref:DUF1989 domain-containing protein n=1 Tax=Streptomyces lushanensis TaxID=1434255 RepID=UPI00082FE533|nr:urea carboxylase-associated family protein [Streptomyces lushanensis]